MLVSHLHLTKLTPRWPQVLDAVCVPLFEMIRKWVFEGQLEVSCHAEAAGGPLEPVSMKWVCFRSVCR